MERALLGVVRALNLAVVVALTATVGVICALGGLALTGVAQVRYELTGSMAPYIEPGDLVVYRPTTGSRLRAGQVVSFVPPGAGTPVTHRVSAVGAGPAGTVTVATRGDANRTDDQEQVAFTRDQRVWQARWVVPALGGPVAALSGGHGLPFVAGLLPLFVLLPWVRRTLAAAIAAHDPPEEVPAGG